ncbi:hypothetical protein CRENBAI_023969 [Crenichthys baileyi]|uniref:Uncharacterized protein n=1 Tax=Crenichthys baileyi TaxID=28760 RepID=A0AAV9SH44_9TELE
MALWSKSSPASFCLSRYAPPLRCPVRPAGNGHETSSPVGFTVPVSIWLLRPLLHHPHLPPQVLLAPTGKPDFQAMCIRPSTQGQQNTVVLVLEVQIPAAGDLYDCPH